MIKQLYVIPNFNCNLKCPHCDIRTKSDCYNEEQFLKQLNSLKSEWTTLFGGEPLLYKDRFEKVIKTEKINTISSNLLLLDDYSLDLLKEYEIRIATSWNPQRFTKEEYDLWIEKLNLLNRKNQSTIVMITLTEDLLSFDKEILYKMFDSWERVGSITGILFEFLVDPESKPDLNDRADDWLCNIHNDWRWNSLSKLIEDNLENNICDCSRVYTLLPSGRLQKGCPHNSKPYHLEQCYDCKFSSICQPCRLQKYCSFPKKLYSLLNGEK